jgi:hypothetical protein
VRKMPGPLALDASLSRLTPEQRDEWYEVTRAHSATPETLLDLAVFWADGQRTLLDIADLVNMETGKRDVEYMVRYLRLLQALELVLLQ